MSVALSIKDIRKTEVILPIARKNAVVTPLLLGEHHVLKTAVLSPQNYDRELLKCLYKHTMFVEKDEDGTFINEYKPKYDEFINIISNHDKIMLLWACYHSTYGDLGLREITCPKCGEKNQYKITLEELLQPDSLHIWESDDIPFYNYNYPVTVPYENYEYIFEMYIPNALKYNQVLSLIPIDKIKANLESNVILTGSEELAMMVKSIAIKKDGTEIAKSNNLQEILMTLDSALPSTVSEEVEEKYKKRFIQYFPKFYTKLSCGACKNVTDHHIDIETEFFRRILYGRELVEEKL